MDAMVSVKRCPDCADFTAIPSMGNGKCDRCNGTGRVRKLGRPKRRVKCTKCGGTGFCPHCKGFGTV